MANTWLDSFLRGVDNLNKRPLAFTAGASMAFGIWMFFNYRDAQEARIKELKDARAAYDETIRVQNRMIGSQDTILRYKDAQLQQLLETLKPKQ